MKIFETHAHYEDEQFDNDRDQLISKLQPAGIERVVNVGSNMETSRKCVKLSEEYPFIYGAVGIHPDSAGEAFFPENLKELERLLNEKKTVALGEIGLDYHYENDEKTKELQSGAFRRQLELAVKTGKPVIIHSRDAAKDTFDTIYDFYSERPVEGCPGVIHCFSGSPEMAAEYIKLGFFIGVGGAVTFKNSKKLRKVVQTAPLASIVLETDCPYMAPEPVRGTRNSSLNLKYVAEKIGELKGISPEEVAAVTYENALRLYHMEEKK